MAYFAPSSPDAERQLGAVQSLAFQAWAFARPLLQLVIVLLIVQWFLTTQNVTLKLSDLGISWDSRLLLALIVIVTFCIWSLVNHDFPHHLRVNRAEIGICARLAEGK
jgi:hypothetical protein